MNDKINVIRNALYAVLSKRNYLLLALVASVVMLFLNTFIPIFVTPSNDLEFFLSITPVETLIFLVLMSGVMGLLVAMQVYAFKHSARDVKSTTTGVAAFFSSLTSGLFASATCSTCVGAVFSFLGAGSIFFLIEHRIEIIVIGSVLVLFSIYFISKKITGDTNCESCKLR